MVEDVGLEPLFMLPKQACYHYTTSSIYGTNVDPTSEPSSPPISFVACYEMAISQAVNNCNPTSQYLAGGEELESPLAESKSAELTDYSNPQYFINFVLFL